LLKIITEICSASILDTIKVSHWEVLYYLIESQLCEKTVAVTDIPLGTQIPATTARRLLRSLKKTGIIATNQDKNDKRRIIAELDRECQQEVFDFVSDYTYGFAGLIQRHDKQERKFAEAALEKTQEKLFEGEERFRKLVQDISAAVVVHASDTSITLINDKALELLGITELQAKSRKAIDPEWMFLNIDGTPVEFKDYPVNQVVASLEPMNKMDLGIWRTDISDIVWVHVSAVPVFNHGNLSEIIVSFMDITENIIAEEKMKKINVLFNQAEKIGKLGYWEWDEINERLVSCSEQCANIYGMTPRQMIKTLTSVVKKATLVHEDDRERYTQICTSKNKQGYDIEYRINDQEGSDIFIREISEPLFDEQGAIIKSIGIVQDISDRKMAEREIAKAELRRLNDSLEEQVKERTVKLTEAKTQAEILAKIDPLSSLNNRRAFFEQANKIEALANRYNHQYTIIMIDLDNFKMVNDNYGHATGDEIIELLGKKIIEVIRSTDIAGRIGGEEFAIILPETKSDKAFELAERLRSEIAALKVNTSSEDFLTFTASIGVAELNTNDTNFNDTLQRADKALYQAKEQGRNRVEVCQ
jgi:diguanylate cyclase (GGDEF)-like protein/PAS domain S-box-containing protein